MPKMHLLGSLQCSSRVDPIDGLKGPTSKGREGRKGRGREDRGGEGKGKGQAGEAEDWEGKGKSHTGTTLSPLQALGSNNDSKTRYLTR